MTKITLVLLVAVSYLSLVASAGKAEAVGLQVKPSSISLQAQIGEKISTRIQVFNPSGEVTIFDVYPDSFESEIKTSPASFILEAGESREVFISFEFKEIGQFSANLSVIARSLSKNSFNAGGGLKIPILINVGENENNLLANIFSFFGQNQNSFIGFLAFVTIIIFIVLGVRFLVRKRKASNP